MLAVRAMLLVAACGCQGPRARLEATRLEGTRAELWLVTCRTSGFPARPRYAWKLPPAAKTIGIPPLDEDALLLQLGDRLRTAEIIECSASGDGNLAASARLGLGPSEITGARVAGEQLIVEGSGFAPQAGEDDGVWLVPGRGRALRADHACKGAIWSENRLQVCLPKLANKDYQVRVQSGGRLALGPALTLGKP